MPKSSENALELNMRSIFGTKNKKNMKMPIFFMLKRPAWPYPLPPILKCIPNPLKNPKMPGIIKNENPLLLLSWF